MSFTLHELWSIHVGTCAAVTDVFAGGAVVRDSGAGQRDPSFRFLREDGTFAGPHEDGMFFGLPQWRLLCSWGNKFVFREEKNPTNLLPGRADSLDLSSYIDRYGAVARYKVLGESLLLAEDYVFITVRDNHGKMELVHVIRVGHEDIIMPFRKGFLTLDVEGTIWYRERERKEVFCQIDGRWVFPGGHVRVCAVIMGRLHEWDANGVEREYDCPYPLSEGMWASNTIGKGNCWGHAVFFVRDEPWARVPPEKCGAFVYTGQGHLQKISDTGEGAMYGHRAYLKDGDRIRCYEIRANPLSLLECCKDFAKEFLPDGALKRLPVELREAIAKPRRRSERLLSKRRPSFQ